jgi:hypothetical protein
MAQGDLFGGVTFDPTADGERLLTLLRRVQYLMSDGAWRTLAEIQQECGGSEASVSARLRDLRKRQWGGHCVLRRRVDRGLWQYRVMEVPIEPPNSDTL